MYFSFFFSFFFFGGGLLKLRSLSTVVLPRLFTGLSEKVFDSANYSGLIAKLYVFRCVLRVRTNRKLPEGGVFFLR